MCPDDVAGHFVDRESGITEFDVSFFFYFCRNFVFAMFFFWLVNSIAKYAFYAIQDWTLKEFKNYKNFFFFF